MQPFEGRASFSCAQLPLSQCLAFALHRNVSIRIWSELNRLYLSRDVEPHTQDDRVHIDPDLISTASCKDSGARNLRSRPRRRVKKADRSRDTILERASGATWGGLRGALLLRDVPKENCETVLATDQA